ncbi:extracellular calcium-sensing receptor-like [Latimeria chalumnae]|uniref:extracellular calcium-sensing receptor-like n=1 Tax=Latimeria chalumnae TaxID=7897 RepID=UPI0003C10D2A|nr:PREDICTED: extracellular calcium-sensing receptor-like [Latimeria chalumnae]|eukprot:XP_006009625.1 PREDICTED: extracellular calcium-sensing receptor-like [Latimeria chalumnae]
MTQQGCTLHSLNVKGYIEDGDIIIGGIFPLYYSKMFPDAPFTEMPELVYCETLRFRHYRWVQGMVFAIEEINKNKQLLPNISLGFAIYASCNVAARAIKGIMWMVTGQEETIPNYRCDLQAPLAAIVGGGASSMSIPMARISGIYKYPQISYASSVVLLSDKHEFPSFFRTIPSDEFHSMGLARLVMHFGWTWVGLIAEDSNYGLQGILSLEEEIVKGGGCVAFSKIIPQVYNKNALHQIIENIKHSMANVFVIISNDASANLLMEEVERQNITGKVWIASDGWSPLSLYSENKFLKTLIGTIGIMTRQGEIPGFQEFLFNVHPSKSPNDTFIKEFWEDAFGCKWPDTDSQTATNELSKGSTLCTGTEKLNELNNAFVDASNLRLTYNIYNAVYAAAYALHDLYSCKPGKGPFANGSCANIHDFEPWQLLHYVKNVHFINTAGKEVFFDENGDPPPAYDILNWQLLSDGSAKNVRIGMIEFSTTQGPHLIINESAIMWNGGQTQIPRSVCTESCPPGYRKAIRPGKPICCFDCIMCSKGEISNQTDSSECMKCPDDHWSNERQDTCIPKPTEFLSYEDSMGTTLAAISIFCAVISVTVLYIFITYRDTPIVKANNRELSYFLLLALVLCFLCSLIFIGKPQTWTCMLRQTAFGIIFALCVSCVLAKTIMVVIAFNATKPNSNLRKWVGTKVPNTVAFICTIIQVIICISWLAISPPFPEQNMTSQTGMIIIECNEGSTIAFWCVLGYMGLLAVISFVVAFLARNLPDSFNEAKFITFSMLVFVSVWLAFIPAYLSTRGKYMVAVEIFAILASGAGLLTCIFSPKCYVIILRPDMNTKEHLMGRGTPSNKKNHIKC